MYVSIFVYVHTYIDTLTYVCTGAHKQNCVPHTLWDQGYPGSRSGKLPLAATFGVTWKAHWRFQ